MTDTVSVPVEHLRTLLEHGRYYGWDGDTEDGVTNMWKYNAARWDIRLTLKSQERNENETGMLERLLEKALHYIRQKRLSH